MKDPCGASVKDQGGEGGPRAGQGAGAGQHPGPQGVLRQQLGPGHGKKVDTPRTGCEMGEGAGSMGGVGCRSGGPCFFESPRGAGQAGHPRSGDPPPVKGGGGPKKEVKIFVSFQKEILASAGPKGAGGIDLRKKRYPPPSFRPKLRGGPFSGDQLNKMDRRTPSPGHPIPIQLQVRVDKISRYLHRCRLLLAKETLPDPQIASGGSKGSGDGSARGRNHGGSATPSWAWAHASIATSRSEGDGPGGGLTYSRQ